jgi:transcriptional regulator with XRE-family HTH domain
MHLAARNARRTDPEWVGRRLAALRGQAGLSQAAVAERMGRPTSVPYRLERGSHRQRLDLVAEFCTAVGADVEAVFQIDGKNDGQGRSGGDPGQTPEVAEW